MLSDVVSNSRIMKTNIIVIVALILLPSICVISQNQDVTKPPDNKELQINAPEISTEYSITNFKNVDFRKMNPVQLEAAGLHTEIYISNTNQGVIIISSTEANKALKDFSHTLEFNPTYYETFTRHDTTILLSGNNKNPQFNFTKASSMNHDYKNAFNNTIDPRTGVSWSKGNYDDINVIGDTFFGQLLYDVIIWLPKGIK